jgi:hypothetical protein
MADKPVSGLSENTSPNDNDFYYTSTPGTPRGDKFARWSTIKATLKTYFDTLYQNALGYTAENTANKASDFTTLNNTKYPTTQAVENRIDTKVAAAVVGLYDDRGNYNASGNTFPASGGSGTSGAILKGDIWTISVAGTLGGTAVIVGQTVRALVDTPGQTAANWAISVGSSEVASASETAAGIVERATQSETDTGTDDSRYITPLKLSTWSGLLGKVLTGLSLATNAAITASDTILSALGKLQKQITDLITTVAGKEPSLGNPDVDGKVLSSTAAGVRSWITAGGSSSDASETVKGIAEIATQTEVNTGTDDTRFVTPLKLSSRPIPLTQLDNQAALTVLANATNASAKPTAVAATTAERVFGRNASNALAFVQVATNYIADLAVSTAKIAANAVTRAKLSQSPGYTVIGNPTGSTADPTDWEAVDLYSRTATATDYTVLATDTKVVVTSTAAARTMTIGFAASSVTAGHEILFKDESNGAATNNITITPNGSDTIEDGTINTNGGVLKIYSDGVSKWWKIYKQ